MIRLPSPCGNGLRVTGRGLLLFACVLAIHVQSAFAYEFSTHAAMTREAVRRSQLVMDSGLLDRLGLGTRAQDLGHIYIDVSNSGDWTRSSAPPTPVDFAKKRLQRANFYDALLEFPDVPSYVGWTMLGSIREDDVKPTGDEEDDTPTDVPGSPIDRVLNHFFDPTDETGIPITVVAIGAPADVWALGSGLGVDNHFSIASAREALWRAVTLTTVDNGSLLPLALPSGFPSIPPVAGEQLQPEVLRFAYWATVFRSLGDAVHLLQDMAQPQHTRFDLHGGRYCVWGSCAVGHASYYEAYVEAKIGGAQYFPLKERTVGGHVVDPIYTEQVTLQAPNLSGYSVPAFTDYKSYFTTGKGTQSASGKGLANYSNQGFFTAGTNLGSSTGYASPPLNVSAYDRYVVASTAVLNARGGPVNAGDLTLFRRVVNDANGGSTPVASLSASGAFDQFMNSIGRAQFTLNHYVYDDQAALLLPRATAYSAGFINYFFRGRLDVSLPDENIYGLVDHLVEQMGDSSGFRRIKLRVTNKSPAGNDMSNGRFVLVAKYHRDKTYAADLSGNPGGPGFTGMAARSIVEEIRTSQITSLSTTLPVNGQASLAFQFDQPIPINASDLVFQLIFRGQMGTENDAVVVGTKDIGEPTFFGFGNNTDYVWDVTGQRFVPLPFAGYTAPDDVLDLKVRFSSTSTTPIATLPKLSVKQHAQLAVLTDVGQQNAYYDYHSSSTIQTYPTVNFQYNSTQFFSPANSSTYDANVKVSPRRGVYRQNYAAFNYPRDDVLICLVQTERCTQSTLPPLSPADRVAWTINF